MLMGANEALDKIDEQEKAEAQKLVKQKPTPVVKAKIAQAARARASILGARDKKPVVAAEMTAADRAMLRKQKEETHQYGRRAQIIWQWLLLANTVRQSTANSVLAESAIDLAKWHEH